MLGEPRLAFFRPAVHGRRAIATAQDATDRDDNDIDEEVFAIARMPGIGQRLEVASNRADIDKLGHERTLCHQEAPARPSQPRLATDRSPFDTKIAAHGTK